MATKRQMKTILCAALLLLLAGCQRYQTLAKCENGVVYLKDNQTGKIYFLYESQMHEVQVVP